MNNIPVSICRAKASHLAPRQCQILWLLSGLAAVAFILQYALVRLAPPGPENGMDALLSMPPHGERKQQSYFFPSSLAAVTIQFGEIQTRPQCPDALGICLAKLARMKPDEFRFDQQPVQRVPLVTALIQEMTEASLGRQLDRLARLVQVSSGKRAEMDAAQLQNHLGRELLPPVWSIEETWPSTGFGWRVNPFTGAKAMHEGIDYMAPQGTPIRALAGGVVVYSENHPQYGNMVEIDHGNDIVTRYAHASRLLVKNGQVVWRGEKIAEVGSTGRSTGSHLHFEVRYKGIAQNPVRFLQNAAS